jgi:NDP-sugar pyrophosphorylase family protein
MIRRAIILAGGKGTRLKPYTITLPKPLVPIGEMPILEIIIRQLKNNKFSRVTIAVNHMADIIKAYFGDGSKWGIEIDYSVENSILSTMGPLTLINDLPDNFLVMNGDVLTNLNYLEFFDNHVNSGNLFTICSSILSNKNDFGVLIKNEKSQLVKFEEKPVSNFLVSMGIYMMDKKNLDFIPKNTFFGFDHLMDSLIRSGNLPNIYEFNGYWLDIGRPADYEKAVNDLENNQILALNGI